MSALRKPSPLDFKKTSQWPAWIKQFEKYRSPTALNKASREVQMDHKVTSETAQTEDCSEEMAGKQQHSFPEEGLQASSSPEVRYQGAGVNPLGQKRHQQNIRQCSHFDDNDETDTAGPAKALKCPNCGSKVHFQDACPKEDKSAQQKEPETAASTTIDAQDVLASQIEEALPDITETSLKLLMQSFEDLGVNSQEDALRLAEPHILVEILGLDQAKKLIAHFNKHSTSTDWVVTDGGWGINHRSSHVNNQFLGMTEIWNKGHKKRQGIMEDAMRNLDDKLTQAERIGEDTINGIKASLSRATQAHKEMLQDLREEETRFAKAMEKKRKTRKREEEKECERRVQEEQLLYEGCQSFSHIVG